MTHASLRTLIAFVVVATFATVAHAQPRPPAPPPPPGAPGPPGMPGEDPIGDRVFPPDLIMSHQADIGLDDKTRASIVDEIQKFQTNIVKIEWDLRAAGEQLAKDLEQPNVDETKTLAQADKVMALEHDLKKAHLTLLIRLKNKLTPEQQSKLRSLRGRP